MLQTVAILGYPGHYLDTPEKIEQGPVASFGYIDDVYSSKYEGDVIWTTARAEGGNSGSPLLDEDCQVLGVIDGLRSVTFLMRSNDIDRISKGRERLKYGAWFTTAISSVFALKL